MTATTHQLAQMNVSRLVAPLDDARLRGFVRASGPMDAAARRAPGFVWRMPLDDAAAAERGRLVDELDGAVGLVTNVSVWTDVESLVAYVRGVHRPMVRRRLEWFLPADRPMQVCWWVATGRRPTIDEAADRLDLLRAAGPSASAFPPDRPFAAPADC